MSGMLEVVGVNALGATLLAGVVAAATRWVTRPAVVHGLWLLVLVELVSLPVFGLVVLQSPARAMATAGPATGAAESVALVPWRAIATATWLSSALLVLALALYRSFRFNRLLRTTSQASATLATDAAGLASRMGVAPCPELRVVPVAISPMLWFTGRSLQILLPEGLLRRLAPLEVQALIAHELAHVCRRDHWVRWLELLAGALFWWHPVTWWARRAMRKAEEESCDALVVRALPEHARAYADGLLKTVEFVVDAQPNVPALACGAVGARNLRERLTMILKRQVAAPSSPRQRCLLAIAAGALLFVAPTIGQTTILVTVNGLPVTQTDLDTARTNALRQASPQTDAQRQQVIQEITPEVIANEVDELLLVQRGRQLGYALGEEQFQRVLDGIKEENDFDDEQLLVALQRDEGMTLPELRDVMERQMLVTQVQQIEILGGVSITDTEARHRAVYEYVNTLRNEAIIEWEDEGLKGLYDEFLEARLQP